MIEYLGKEVEVKIDRPLGTLHPEYNFYYLVIILLYINFDIICLD